MLCFQKFLHEKACIKGINFQVPNGDGMCKSADMYGYGCLVLWVSVDLGYVNSILIVIMFVITLIYVYKYMYLVFIADTFPKSFIHENIWRCA